MKVEVVYARSDVQVLIALELWHTATVLDAIERSGLLARFPEIDLSSGKVGVFSQPCGLDRTLRDGDRVEIYRPLRSNPQQLRRNRAAHQADR